MATYRCAIIGCGPRAEWHAKAYGLVERGGLVACCDLDSDRLNSFASRFGLAPYADAQAMLDAESPDLVHIVTPPTARVELMRLVSDRHVPASIVEKPIACAVRDWRQLRQLQAETHTKFAVGKQFRWHADLTRCREALRSGRLGRLLFLDFSAGMNISGQGTHIIDWAMSLNEDCPAVRVFGAASGVDMSDEHHPAPDTTVGLVLFANGVRGVWNNGFTAPRVGDPRTSWQHCRVAAYAERGRTLYEEFGKWEVVSPEGTESGGDASRWEQGNHAAQAALTNAMFDWIEDESKPAGTGLERALHQWNVVLGLYASALLRKPVEIPFDPPDDLFERLCSALARA